MVAQRFFGNQLPGLNIPLAITLMNKLEGSPWRLVSGGAVRTFTKNSAHAMAEWVKSGQIAGRAVFFIPPGMGGGHVYLVGRLPLTASPAALNPPPQFVIVSDDYTCIWRIVEPVDDAKAARMAAGLVAKQDGKPAVGEPVPLPGTVLTRAAGVGLAHRYPVSLLPPLAAPAYYFSGHVLRAEEPAVDSLTMDADEIEAAPMEWLWPDVIPVGALTLLGGAPGMGKSQAAISMAAILSSGGTWPTGERAEPGAALVLEAEDDLARTVKPRLIAAGADTKRVGLGVTVDLTEGPDRLEAEWKRRKGLRLIVLSPIRKFLGKAEHRGNTGVRDVLAPVLSWAEQRRVALLGICHPPKGKENKEAFAGSAAILEVARAAYSVLADPASKEPIVKRKPRLMVSAKGNLGPDNLALRYRIESFKTKGGIETSRVIWQGRRESE
jgi:hypothetical protein